MRSTRNDRKHTADEFAVLVDAARVSAVQARREALVAFWREVSARLRCAWDRFLASPGAVFDRPVDPSWPHATR